ncbi:MAG: PAS domain S-box protein, partial [Gemmatimonadota bacterium]
MPGQRAPSLEGLVSFLEYAPDPAVVTDRAHRIVVVNHSAESLFGYRHLELVGRPLRDLVPNLRLVDPEEGRSRHEETTILGQHRNGTRLTLSVAFRAVPVEQGLLTATYFRAHSPADSNAGAARTLDRLPIAVVRFAADGEAQYANDAARLLLGTGGTIGPALDSLILPDKNREELRAAFESARAGRPVRLELPIRTFGGERWLECHLLAEAAPGEPSRSVLLVATDLTPHRDAENALHRAELRFARIAEGSEDLISQHSPAGEFTYASPASSALLGLPPTSILGQSLLDFVVP